MKKIFLVVLLSGLLKSAGGQNRVIDSLRQKLSNAKNDTSKVLAISSIADYYGFIQFDSSMFYARQVITTSEKLRYKFGKLLGFKSMFFALNCQGNYPKALEAVLNMLQLAEDMKKDRPGIIVGPHYFLGVLNREMGNFPNAVYELNQAIELQEKANRPMTEVFYAFSQLAIIQQKSKRLDSALWYAQRGYDLGLQSREYNKYFSLAIAVLGNVHEELGNYELAKNYFLAGIQQSKSFNNIYFQARNYNLLAAVFNKMGLQDSSIYYAEISLQLCEQHNFSEFKLDAASLLTRIFESRNIPDTTLKYMRIMMVARDSVFSQSKVKQFQKNVFDESQRQQEINVANERYREKIKLYAALIILFVFFIIAFILYRSFKQKQKANKKIEQAYQDLKSTQAQLIQSEKMASLGELTAGIAHEIQNPLNFVNNFSEVNKELIGEMKSEIEKGNMEEVKAIANDIEANEEKISLHGKRADSIVKGMLQHSRTSSGQKEPTDINALCDEYLRLSYHGFKAKDKNFNATIKTDFNDTIGKINIIPEDFGRVMLNLFTNAFYALKESASAKATADGSYQPTVTVTTKKIGDKVEIIVADNGNGIPEKILGKVFQPFFTTKPAGQGTGLGLSLSYDIIKAHGGELKVKNKESEGAVFIIEIPTT